ncbi:hypothetical protein CRG98_014083, partial [Punica granatum]
AIGNPKGCSPPTVSCLPHAASRALKAPPEVVEGCATPPKPTMFKEGQTMSILVAFGSISVSFRSILVAFGSIPVHSGLPWSHSGLSRSIQVYPGLVQVYPGLIQVYPGRIRAYLGPFRHLGATGVGEQASDDLGSTGVGEQAKITGKPPGFLTTLTLPREEVVMIRGPIHRAQPPFHLFYLYRVPFPLTSFLSRFQACPGFGTFRTTHGRLDPSLRSPTSSIPHRAVVGASVPAHFPSSRRGCLPLGSLTHSL